VLQFTKPFKDNVRQGQNGVDISEDLESNPIIRPGKVLEYLAPLPCH
jgi:hypothetical protein